MTPPERVLVTGGTGVLGTQLVQRLRERTEVRVLSRRPSREVGFVQGDLETGEGLAAAVEGIDAIVHCASAADYRRPSRDVVQLQKLLDAAGGSKPHLVYVSIVGVDRIRFGFFQAKLDNERLVEHSGLPWTILRATQFHDLILMSLARLSRGPLAVVPRKALVQPVDAGEVAERMVDLTMGRPAGRVPDFGGPKVESMEDLMRAYLADARRRRPVVAIPIGGRIGAALGVGGHLLTDDDKGTVAFLDYLRARGDADGSTEHPPH